jgi:hypothetical protein
MCERARAVRMDWPDLTTIGARGRRGHCGDMADRGEHGVVERGG